MAKRKIKVKRADTALVMIEQPGEVVFGVRQGLFGHPSTLTYRLKHEEIVGAVERPEDLGQIVTKLGVLALAQLLRHNLAYGTEGMAKRLSDWAGIDLEALAKEAAYFEETADVPPELINSVLAETQAAESV